MKKTIVLSALLLSFSLGRAQQISLTEPEIKTLKNEIKSKAPVKALYQEFYATAADALMQAPNPIEKVRSQGLLQGDPIKTASLKAVEDMSKIYALALVSRVSGEKKFRKKAEEYLTAWAGLNQATGDPIDETKLEDAVTGYDLIRAELTTDQQAKIDNWLIKIADSEVNSVSAEPGKSTAKNNWNSHRIKMIALISRVVHSSNYDVYIKEELEKQLAVNLNADGSSFDFYERDALHYHIYTLEPLLKAIIALNRSNNSNYFDFISTSGSSVKKSVDFLVPFVTGEKRHQEFLNSKVAFDKARANNKEKDYQPGADFVPSKGIVVLSLASYFDETYLRPIYKASIKGEAYLDWQLVLNHVRKPFLQAN
ncbi:hypothetical protein GS399_04185 [Pedobacter sp. HMF7647]|uniref:Alginate lyase domain-containing protein n=1 Tax=Hufsiella arboris TaxID=2695275 RepID=A0A7K1Y7X2_9SPHI|nr:alginate lyase family protein [Hufsiella arboris]MXV50158.1 hypothetical protein [Hufsiella arboris]